MSVGRSFDNESCFSLAEYLSNKYRQAFLQSFVDPQKGPFLHECVPSLLPLTAGPHTLPSLLLRSWPWCSAPRRPPRSASLGTSTTTGWAASPSCCPSSPSTWACTSSSPARPSLRPTQSFGSWWRSFLWDWSSGGACGGPGARGTRSPTCCLRQGRVCTT